MVPSVIGQNKNNLEEEKILVKNNGYSEDSNSREDDSGSGKNMSSWGDITKGGMNSDFSLNIARKQTSLFEKLRKKLNQEISNSIIIEETSENSLVSEIPDDYNNDEDPIGMMQKRISKNKIEKRARSGSNPLDIKSSLASQESRAHSGFN